MLDTVKRDDGYRFKLVSRSGVVYARTTEEASALLRSGDYQIVSLDGNVYVVIGNVVLETSPEQEEIPVTRYRFVYPQAAHESGIPWEVVRHFGPFEIAFRWTGETDNSKRVYEYALWDHEWPEVEIFHGHDFLATATKSDAAKAMGLFDLLSRREEDADPMHFVNYTPAQLRWRDERAETAQRSLDTPARAS